MSRVQQLATNITELLNSEQTTEEGSPAIRQLLEHKLKMCGQAECEQKELLAGIADACLSPHVTTANARVTLMELVELLEKEGCELAAETKQATFQYILGKIQQRLSEFEDVIFNARIALSKVYQSEGEWTKAAAELQSLPFDQAQRSYDPEFRFEQYVTTMRLYLEADDPTMAMAALQRATPLLTLVKNKQHILMFQLSQARIFDSEHKYIEAANLYQTVAQSEELDANEKARFVGLAINCAVLSAAGPQRSQMLARLYRDKLASDLMTFTVLESMHLRRLIKPKDLEHFEEGLAQHQKAVLGDGKTTILSRAVREHNMFVLSSLYSNIKFENLGRSLGVDADEAEQMCAKMIAEGRMKGRIDQVDGVIMFEGAREVKEVASAISIKQRNEEQEQPAPMYLREMVAAKWDKRIVGLCQTMEEAVDLLIEKQPVCARALFSQL